MRMYPTHYRHHIPNTMHHTHIPYTTYTTPYIQLRVTGAKVMFIEVTRVADRNFDNASLAKVNVSGMPDYADVDKDVAVRIMTFSVFIYMCCYIYLYTKNIQSVCYNILYCP